MGGPDTEEALVARVTWRVESLSRCLRAVLVRPTLRGPSSFYPEVAGLLLEPCGLEGFPEGLDVIVSGQGLPLDLSGLKASRT